MRRDDNSDPAEVVRVCIRGLTWGLDHALENDMYIGNYPVNDFENNIVRELLFACGAGLLGDWLDDILEEYMSEVQSSAALAVNCFGPLLLNGTPFELGGHRDLRVASIGRATRRGFCEPDEPALYVTAAGPGGTVVIDVSCLDYLSVQQPSLSAPVGASSGDPAAACRPKPVGASIDGASPDRLLDTATLVDRAQGSGDDPVPPTVLFYVYWEPLDAGFSRLFERHREEVAVFAQQFAEGQTRFEATSCFALWDAWATSDDPRLRDHAATLRARYEVPAWAWEGVSWVNGRIGIASDFLDDDDY